MHNLTASLFLVFNYLKKKKSLLSYSTHIDWYHRTNGHYNMTQCSWSRAANRLRVVYTRKYMWTGRARREKIVRTCLTGVTKFFLSPCVFGIIFVILNIKAETVLKMNSQRHRKRCERHRYRRKESRRIGHVTSPITCVREIRLRTRNRTKNRI